MKEHTAIKITDIKTDHIFKVTEGKVDYYERVILRDRNSIHFIPKTKEVIIEEICESKKYEDENFCRTHTFKNNKWNTVNNW